MIPKQQQYFGETTNEGKSVFELGRWNPVQSPVTIEFQPQVLSDVRDQSTAGLRKLARGGVEVAGVFFGTRSGRSVQIAACRPIQCEYKSGPFFLLSESDKDRLREQLSKAASDPDLRDLLPVGWYVSHPRGEVMLGDRDLEVYNEFFPDIDQVTLVVKPAADSVRCGFFVREPRGFLQCAESYQEFDLGASRSNEGVSAIRQIAERARANSPGRLDDWDPVQHRRNAHTVAEMPMPVGQRNDRGRANGNVAAQATSSNSSASSSMSAGAGTAVAPAKYLPNDWSPAVARPRALILAQMANERRRRLQWRWLVAWAVVMATLIGCIFLYRIYTAPTPLGLRVVEKADGSMLVQWDPASRSINWASSGKLGIRGVDGSSTEIDLAKDQLALGAYLDKTHVGDVLIRLSVDNRWGFRADESTHYVPRAGQPDVPKLNPKMDKQTLQIEVQRLHDELNRNQQRIKELESLLYNR